VRNSMKLFQQLLVAPAALGLVAPMAATAAELDINGVSGYSDSVEEVQTISQFSDVYPTDWAYQALTNLAERHGCTTATPSGSITRYEAAALLNGCLGNVAQVNEEERRLLNEFATELAVIKGRIDGLEARVGEFEAGQFSTTTKLTGKVNFVVGGYERDVENAGDGAITFNYSAQYNLNTSFTGDDLLYTRIKTGNFVDGAHFEKKDYGAYLVAANDNANAIEIDKLWYQFPVGESFKVWVGPEIESYYMLASAPSIYKPVLKQFALGGNGAAYGASTSQGAGVAWTQQVSDRSQPRFAISTNYTALEGDSAADETGGGLFTDNQSNWLTKFEYGSPRWQVSLAIAQSTCEVQGDNKADRTCGFNGSYFSTQDGKNRTGNTTAYGLRAYWKPDTTASFIPAIQAGYDLAYIKDDGTGESAEETAAWMFGFMWRDAFIDGNTAGVAIGKRQHMTEGVQCESGGTCQDDPADDNFVWEAYYDFKVSDNITVTPAIFGGTDTYNGASDDSDDIFGGLVKTTFKF